ncbi:SGNH/GDSL hydrolase family protein [Caulobacter sp. DWP3-1-3b2]|uniref:SGNH/GDSL hydrolase family protein n=1 Tax=Caulobacter sp. DWP3-1-3b2 TaxID=2804643 RepID=UPI003CFA6250
MIQTRWTLGALAAALLIVSPFAAGAQPPSTKTHWVGSWAASQQVPEPQNALAPQDLSDATLRQIVRLTAGGRQVRVRLSNVHGTAPLRFTSVHVAKPLSVSSPRIDVATDHAATFSGQTEVVVPAGAEYLSDPIDLSVAPLSDLAITVYLPASPERQTSHPGSRATSYVLAGQHVADADLPGAKTVDHWFALSGVDVVGQTRGAVVILGDSITDGYGVAPNSNLRWPDHLAARLQASAKTRHLSVLNQGIGGNRVLRDGSGPNALARFERDVLSQTGVAYLIVLEGVNDLGVLTRDAPATPEAHAALVRDMTGAYGQMIERARARGIKVIGATILPYAGSAYYHPTAVNEADRQAINAWIRAPGHFDAVIDFDLLMRDPAKPERLNAAYDNDGLHPSMAGYKTMADAIPLSLFDQ